MMKIYPYFHYAFYKVVLKTFLRSFLKLRYHEKTALPSGKKIFVINHPTVWDAFPLMVSLKESLHVLVEDQIWSFPVPRFIFSRANQVRLYTGKEHKTTQSDAFQLLDSGKNLLVSPEGGRTPSGTSVRARKYPVIMALKARAPIVPVGVHITPEHIKIQKVNYNIDGNKYSDDSLIPRFRAPYGVVVGDPVHLDEYFDKDLSADEYQSIADDILKKVYLLSDEASALFSG